jgi:hypothetical protein
MDRKTQHNRRKNTKLAKTNFSRRMAKVICIRYWNTLRKQHPELFAEMRSYEAPYKAWR